MKTDRFIEDEQNRVAVDVAVEGKTGALDFNTLKTGGIIKQRQRERFTVRLKCPGGRVPVAKLARIVEVAKRFAGDYIHISVRQSIELPYVHFQDIGRVKAELAEVGQEIASCGPRVRVPTACSGCEYNPNGLTNTQQMATAICERFFAKQPLPHKFKISFSGCPIDCARTNEMDLGFQGAVMPVFRPEACTGCRICASACQEGAIASDPESGAPMFDPQKCLYCGDCIRACPTEAWQPEQTGWVVRVGGKHGRHPMNGSVIARFVPDAEIPPIIEAILAWYEARGRGQGRVRIGTLLLAPGAWGDFLAALRPVLGACAVEAPPLPQTNEIHFVPGQP